MNFDEVDMSSFPAYEVPPLRIIFPHVPNPDEVAAVRDFSTVCRICAKVTFHVYPLFDDVGEELELPDIIETHLQMKVRSDDGLPGVVCAYCARALAGWAALRRAARLADTVLRRRLGLLPPPEPKPSETAGTKSEDGKYVDAATDPRPPRPQRDCSLCPLTIPARRYNNHLVDAHNDQVFRCDECHCYIGNEDLFFHYSNYGCPAKPISTLQKADDKRKKKLDEAELKRRDYIDRKKLKEYERKREKAINIQVEELRIKNLNFIPMLDFGTLIKLNESYFEKQRQERALKANQPDTEKQTANTEPSPPEVQVKQEKVSNNKNIKKSNVGSDTEDGQILPNDDDAQESVDDDGDENDNEGNEDTKPLKASPKAKASGTTKKKGTEKSPKASRTCPICGKEYRASSSYFYHMKYFHKRSREHECEVCGKKFGTKANLAQHASVHTGAYDLECKECSKRFRSKASLYIHEQSHGGVKRWACGQCERSFRWRTHLARHVQRHAAQRAHVCATCGRGFSVRCDLLRHARTHAAAEFHCASCGLKFAQKRYLKVHMIKKHSEAPAVVTRS